MNLGPRILFLSATIAACSFLGGCNSDGIATVPVQGKVTMDGKPLPGGIIAFQPVKIVAGLPNHVAQGTIQTDGQYSLSSFQPNDGVVPGEYFVIIHGIQAPEPIDQFSKAAQPTQSGPKIPAIYSSSETTTLKATIPAGGSVQQIDFDLKSK